MSSSRLLLLMFAGAMLTAGCTSVPTADEYDRLQAPDPNASSARNLMKVFGFDLYDREAGGRGDVLATGDVSEHPHGVDLTKAHWGVPSVSGMLDASVLAYDPLRTVHYFGFMPAEMAADERIVVRKSTAAAVERVAATMAAAGWRFAWTRPLAHQMSLGYSVTQDVFFEREGTTCRIPDGIENLRPGEGKGCVVTVAVRSRDVTKGEVPNASGFEPMPRWLDESRAPAWRIRSIFLLSATPEGKPFLTPERQLALAHTTTRMGGFYGFDANGVPFLGWEGDVLRFAATDGAREAAAREAREKAEPMTDRVMKRLESWWPF